MTDVSDKMLLLSPDEHDFLFNLLLDHGSRVGKREVRNQLVHKLSKPMRIEDAGPVRGSEAAREPWEQVDEATEPSRAPDRLGAFHHKPA